MITVPPKKTATDLSYYTGLGVPLHDYISAAYPNGTTEVYTFRIGGASGTVVMTLTVVYTDSSKDAISTVTRAPRFGT